MVTKAKDPTATTPDMSYLSAEQIRRLLAFVNRLRVQNTQGQSNMAAYDIRAHLTRIFGFGRWSSRITAMDLIYEWETTLSSGAPAYDVAYKAACELTICAPDGTELCQYTEWAVGAQKQGAKNRGDVHDFALKTAESQALKRAAMNLGDQFGLSLYNRGSLDAIVMGTLLWPAPDDREELPEVAQQLAEDTDPDAVPVRDINQEPQAPAQQQAQPPAQQGGDQFFAQGAPGIDPWKAAGTEDPWEPPAGAPGAPAAQQAQPAATAPAAQAEPLRAPVSQSPVAEQIAEIQESIGFLELDARGRLQILWKRANLTPLARITTDAEIAKAWELYGQVVPDSPVDSGPPAALEDTGNWSGAAETARQQQVAQAQRVMAQNQAYQQ